MTQKHSIYDASTKNTRLVSSKIHILKSVLSPCQKILYIHIYIYICLDMCLYLKVKDGVPNLVLISGIEVDVFL
jgi:hypothetical protein